MWNCSLTQQILSHGSMQSVPITTKVVSSNIVHGDVFSIQHYVIKFVSDLVFYGYSTDKTDCHDIAEILLKMALNTITKPLPTT